jgi:ABC-type multidrug transport system ATPase subunit
VLHEPDLLMLDEPTAGLDALGFAVFEELLDEAIARGATVIVSSHVFGDVHRRANRLVVLVSGRVVANGAPLELVRSLGPSAELDATLSGLDEPGLAAVRVAVERLGGRLEGVRPAQSNLAALFRSGRSRAKP